MPAALGESDASLFSFLGRREHGDRNFEKAGMDAMSTDLPPMNMCCRKDGRSVGLMSERDKERKEYGEPGTS
ncbi:hypothetical protein KSD_84170 [Ktedonobacter sp. SOSP1-85]|nr:hypothetical protein KSD_84170 [Ktedonobacter sp. SOSP1-85]